MHAYVVTEGHLDARLLRRLLPGELLEGVEITVAGGKSAAVRLAATLLHAHRAPVALIVDADTADPHRVHALRQWYRDLVAPDGVGPRVEAFLAVPELEAVFFADVRGLARALGVAVGPGEVEAARHVPKEVLERLIGGSRVVRSVEELVERLDDETAAALAAHEPVRSLARFLEAAGRP